MAGEFLNDWEAVWMVLSHPSLPLTNNEAERALRHWVILRRISHGTRTPEGSRALALLASVIETCRKRHQFLGHVSIRDRISAAALADWNIGDIAKSFTQKAQSSPAAKSAHSTGTCPPSPPDMA